MKKSRLLEKQGKGVSLSTGQKEKKNKRSVDSRNLTSTIKQWILPRLPRPEKETTV